MNSSNAERPVASALLCRDSVPEALGELFHLVAHLSTLSSIQTLPVALFIVKTARRAEMPIAVIDSGEIMWLGDSKCVILKGSPAARPRSLSNRTPHKLKNEAFCRDTK
jgi:hypothetical protein